MTTEARGAQTIDPLDLRNLIEMMPTPAVCALPDGSVEFVNREWQEYTGCPTEQPNLWVWQTTIHPDDAAKFIDGLTAALAGGKPFQTEARIRRADGQYLWFLIRKVLAVAPTGARESSLRTLITCEDIDERKEAEAKHEQGEGLLQAFFENSPNLISVKDRQSRYLYANKQFKKAFNVFGEVKGKTDGELFSAEQAAAFQAVDRQVLQTGLLMRFEDVALYEDGPHTRIVQKFPLFSAEGEICAIGGAVTDITDRKREESALRYSEENYRLVVETAPDAVISIDERGAILFANPATVRIFGYDPTELIGKPLTILMPEFLRKLHEKGFSRYLATGQRHINWQGTELTALRKNGQEFPVEISFGELSRDGHKVFTGFIRDISERKQAQQALQMTQMELARVSRLTTMGELAASIAHEVNQPLTAVTNNSSACLRLLAADNLKPEVLHRALEEIVADGNRASAVVARIRGFIKKEPLEKNKLDMNDVIQEVLALADRELYENRVRLERQLTKALPLVLADRVQMQQVLLNLIMNGIEAMIPVTDNARSLWVESRVDESGDILVAVRDSGTGLGSAADRVFTPFFTTKANGMGMGLSISRSLVENHGGRLWAMPNSPIGAVFSFTLPVSAGSPA
ncbi:MAG: PAS domain S-box protein [Candidatus Sulfotelmatobacter sp.]|jgi:PAS domain S-box-containing protein